MASYTAIFYFYCYNLTAESRYQGKAHWVLGKFVLPHAMGNKRQAQLCCIFENASKITGTFAGENALTEALCNHVALSYSLMLQAHQHQIGTREL